MRTKDPGRLLMTTELGTHGLQRLLTPRHHAVCVRILRLCVFSGKNEFYQIKRVQEPLTVGISEKKGVPLRRVTGCHVGACWANVHPFPIPAGEDSQEGSPVTAYLSPAAMGELGQDAGTSGPQGSFCEVVGRVLDLETLANEGYRLPSNEEPSLAECNVGEGSPAQL